MYLKVETQYDIQMAFQENSETKLADFFRVSTNPHPFVASPLFSIRCEKEDYFQAMANELKGDSITWIRRGPFNKRYYLFSTSLRR